MYNHILSLININEIHHNVSVPHSVMAIKVLHFPVIFRMSFYGIISIHFKRNLFTKLIVILFCGEIELFVMRIIVVGWSNQSLFVQAQKRSRFALWT